MKQTVTEFDFHEAFRAMNRLDNFSRAGRIALFDWLEDLEDDTGQEMELDVIALCCEFSEYHSPYSWADEYYAGDAFYKELDINDDQSMDDINNAILAHLMDHTTVIEFETGIIIADF